jgi:hypothetical protein
MASQTSQCGISQYVLANLHCAARASASRQLVGFHSRDNRTISRADHSIAIYNDFTVAVIPRLDVFLIVVTPLAFEAPGHTLVTVDQLCLSYI